MAKATVQAALGPVMLKRLHPDTSKEERYYAQTIMMICILSIVVTAPIGAFLISITGPRLLTKTKQAPPTEGTNIHRKFICITLICGYQLITLFDSRNELLGRLASKSSSIIVRY